ncbi:uncharacterized protein LOC135690524 [Rhopilema esculentum]|uniref:uncharacterized protein LOC135690524 n=1 Tax=Rhopilema esculentum TaxID=499914 RepID=UPI0031E3E192|eukprot:gene3294-1626_t
MAMAGAAVGAPAALLAEQDACFNSFCDAVRLIITCKDFNKASFKTRPLNLSEAYVLLWHNTGTGGLDGSKSSMHLRTGAFAAVLIDLLVRDKIAIINDTVHLGCEQHQRLAVKVLDPTPTGTYLDIAGFNHIVAYYKAHPQKNKLLKDWFEREERECCVSVTLKNLIKRKILGDVHTGFFGMFHKYPTKDSSFEEVIEAEMKQVSLKECKPDSFMLSLLTLSRTADMFFSFVDPVLQKHFTKDEYKVAKENIKVIVQTQGAVLRSPKLNRKKMKV